MEKTKTLGPMGCELSYNSIRVKYLPALFIHAACEHPCRCLRHPILPCIEPAQGATLDASTDAAHYLTNTSHGAQRPQSSSLRFHPSLKLAFPLSSRPPSFSSRSLSSSKAIISSDQQPDQQRHLILIPIPAPDRLHHNVRDFITSSSIFQHIILRFA